MIIKRHEDGIVVERNGVYVTKTDKAWNTQSSCKFWFKKASFSITFFKQHTGTASSEFDKIIVWVACPVQFEAQYDGGQYEEDETFEIHLGNGAVVDRCDRQLRNTSSVLSAIHKINCQELANEVNEDASMDELEDYSYQPNTCLNCYEVILNLLRCDSFNLECTLILPLLNKSVQSVLIQKAPLSKTNIKKTDPT